jgi:sugar lactone lactonase YvrE
MRFHFNRRGVHAILYGVARMRTPRALMDPCSVMYIPFFTSAQFLRAVAPARGNVLRNASRSSCVYDNPSVRRHNIPIAVLTLVAGLAASPASASEFLIDPMWIAGGTGSAVGKYGVPESVAIDSLGQIAVTDKGRMMLHIYAAEDGRPLFDVGGLGSTLGEFNRPNGIAVDRTGNILIVEQLNRRVQIFDRNYRPIGSFGQYGGADGDFQKPMGIAIDGAGSIYITDEAREDVQVFDSAGRYGWSFDAAPRLQKVESIEVDPDHRRIFVCDEGRSRVNVYDWDGHFLSWFGGPGTAPGLFGNAPNAIRIDGRGRIYVNDQGNSRINVYRANTEFLASFQCTGKAMVSADGEALSEPHNLFLVADQGNDRLLAFDLGELQCRLGRLEIANWAAIGTLQVAENGTPLDPQNGLVWGKEPYVEFEAQGPAGTTLAPQIALVHVTSSRDRRGLCLPMLESAPGSGRYRGRLALGDRSDEGTGRLATFEDDGLRAHVAGETSSIELRVARYEPPQIEALHAGLGRDGRVFVDTPTFTWSYTQPFGLRPLTAVELRLVRSDATVIWASGTLSWTQTTFTYNGPPLPPAEPLQLQLRMQTGGLWSKWETAPLQRNGSPAAAQVVSPRDGTAVHTWPVKLEAVLGADPEGDPLHAFIEMWVPRGPLVRTHELPVLDDTLTFEPRTIGLSRQSQLHWRVLVSDGHETTAGPWWQFTRHDGDDPPGPDPDRTLDASQGADPGLAGRDLEAPEHDSDPSGTWVDLARSRGRLPVPLHAGLRLLLALPGESATVEIYDVRGRRLAQAALPADGTWTWSGRDARGSRIAPGVYWLRVTGSDRRQHHKVVWVGR